MEPFDFSKKVEKEEMIKRLKYYNNVSEEGLNTGNLSFQEIKDIYNVIKENLKVEYNTYDKEKAKKFIYSNGTYMSYVSSIRDAYVNLKRVYNKEDILRNLCNIQDSVLYGLIELEE